MKIDENVLLFYNWFYYRSKIKHRTFFKVMIYKQNHMIFTKTPQNIANILLNVVTSFKLLLLN